MAVSDVNQQRTPQRGTPQDGYGGPAHGSGDGASQPVSSRVAEPEFATAVRGYDRAQVDDYLAHLHQWLAEAEARTAAAEEVAGAAARELSALRRRVHDLEERADVPAPRSMSAFGERVGALLQAAVQAAEQLRTEAETEAKAVRTTSAAEREAVLARARSEAEQVVEQARRKERAIGKQIDDLATKRAAALTDLGRVRQHLADLLDAPLPVGDRAGHSDHAGPEHARPDRSRPAARAQEQRPQEQRGQEQRAQEQGSSANGRGSVPPPS